MKRNFKAGDRVDVRGTVRQVLTTRSTNPLLHVDFDNGGVIEAYGDECTLVDEPENDALGTIRRIHTGVGAGYVVVKIRTKPGSTKPHVWMSLGRVRFADTPLYFSDSQVRDRSEIVTVIEGAG